MKKLSNSLAVSIVSLLLGTAAQSHAQTFSDPFRLELMYGTVSTGPGVDPAPIDLTNPGNRFKDFLPGIRFPLESGRHSPTRNSTGPEDRSMSCRQAAATTSARR